jgi:hypothetical protein
MSCTAAGEGLVAGLAWAEGAAEETEAEEDIVEGWEKEKPGFGEFTRQLFNGAGRAVITTAVSLCRKP